MKSLLFICVDQLRADALGYVGNKIVKTPHLDALAADAIQFRNHFTCASPCGPSRASLHTGTYPMWHRVVANGAPMPDDIPTLPRMLRNAGYDPTLFGYTDVPVAPRNAPLTLEALHRPFSADTLPDFRVGLLQNYEGPTDWIRHLADQGVYPTTDDPFSIWDRGVSRDVGFSRAPTRYRAEDSDTAFLARRVIDEIERAGDAGFCIHAAFLKPHPPLQAPEPFNCIFNAADMPQPRAPLQIDHPFFEAFSTLQADSTSFDVEMNLGLLTAEQVLEARAVYYGLICELDQWIGAIIEALKTQGVYDETLIVLTSDHGELLGDYGAWGKAHVLDPAWRIPLLMKPPACKTPQVVDVLTESVDILPTILDYCGVEIHADINGRSLRALCEGQSPSQWRDAVMCELHLGDPIERGYEQVLQIPSDQLGVVFYRTQTHKLVVFQALESLLFEIDAEGSEHRVNDPIRQAQMMEALLRHRLNQQSRRDASLRVGQIMQSTPGPRFHA